MEKIEAYAEIARETSDEHEDILEKNECRRCGRWKQNKRRRGHRGTLYNSTS